jgi:hypothetical protein
VDAAALVGAKNLSNPYVNLETLVKEFAEENFTESYLGTQGRSCAVDVTETTKGKITVTGSSSSPGIIARLFGVDTVPVSSSAVAAKKEVEIMMVLDRSGSMSGTKLRALKNAALSFLSYFEDTQNKDKAGLISFATGVTVDRELDNNFVDAMTTKINALSATGSTNAEDALDQCDDTTDRNDKTTTTLTDQTGVPGDQRVQQYVVFFTDGMPTAFRSKFTYNGTDYDAVVCGSYNYCLDVLDELYNRYSGATLNIDPRITGDGKRTTGSDKTTCENCVKKNTGHGQGHGQGQQEECTAYLNTRWQVLEGPYGTGMEQQYCNYDPDSSYIEDTLADFICSTAKQMAIDHAQELKDKYVKIYIIGLGDDVDKDFLGQVASGENYEYYAPTSEELDAVFNAIAKEIKLRLVQ